MKIRSILASCLTMLVLASCSKEGNDVPVDPADVAYVSINVVKQNVTRSSSEQTADPNESDLKELYMITFNNEDKIVGIPGSPLFYSKAPVISGNETKPDAIRIAGASEKLLVIANPGTKLLNALNALNSSSTFATVNSAIINSSAVDALTELSDNAGNTKGFAMISSGSDDALSAGAVISDPLIDITGFIKKTVNYNYDDDAAKAAAEAQRVTVKIERLASKLELTVKTAAPGLQVPTGADFALLGWTLDVLNKEFYPFAKKTLQITHNSGTFYNFNFYTEDPNFSSTSQHTGLDFTTINSTTFAPELVLGNAWLDDGDETYCVENTMAAAEQKFGNATRMVIKATYYPDETWPCAIAGEDWFSFAGVDYQDLGELQAAYTAAGSGNLQNACNKMFDKIDAYATANGLTLIGTDFDTLDPSDLDQLSPYGGEIIKDGSNDVIRWYQGGLNYYYYEIRHNDDITAEMAFGKYGVVRNNWYSMTLASVAGAGTPWYPDINNPGPGDPDPTDPIDESVGYLGVEIDVAPWIFWEREIGI